MPPKKNSFRHALYIVLGLFVSCSAIVGVGAYQLNSYPNQAQGSGTEKVKFEVKRGMTFRAVASSLENQKLISSARLFRFYAMYRGDTTKIKRGTYELSPSQTPKELLDMLIAGVPEKNVSVTLPEGKHMLEYFEILEQNGVAPKAELTRLAREGDFLRELGIQAPTIEGYLFPETYSFRTPTPPRRVLKRLVKKHQEVWESAAKTHERTKNKLQKKLKWNDHQLLTLASIVEKEAVVATEQARIAQVFVNRLITPSFQPKRLETDPTIRYGCMVPVEKSIPCQKWDPTQRLRTIQLRDKENPYNTYVHTGLPPGPIANPGQGAIEAAMNPDGSKFFFFVSRNDKTHVFSKTYSEHSKWVNQYQK